MVLLHLHRGLYSLKDAFFSDGSYDEVPFVYGLRPFGAGPYAYRGEAPEVRRFFRQRAAVGDHAVGVHL